MTQLPLIHLNGTSGKVLLREYADAIDTLDRAIAMLGAVTVHARDYYPIGDRAAIDAAHEHSARMRKLAEVRDDLYLIYTSLLEQMLSRRLHEPEDA